ncbi:MAG: hypothetical protein ACLUL2_07285 [Blautia sp.]
MRESLIISLLTKSGAAHSVAGTVSHVGEMLKDCLFFFGSALAVLGDPFLDDPEAAEKFRGSAVCNAGSIPVQTDRQAAAAFFRSDFYAAVPGHISLSRYSAADKAPVIRDGSICARLKISISDLLFLLFKLIPVSFYCKGVLGRSQRKKLQHERNFSSTDKTIKMHQNNNVKSIGKRL